MGKKAYQRSTQEFKDKAVGSLNLGKPVAEVAQELEVSTFMFYEWRHKAQGTQGGSAGMREPQASIPKRTPCVPCGGRPPASRLRTTF